MTNDQREIRCKFGVLEHADECGYVRKTCQVFGIGRSSFWRWRDPDPPGDP